MMRRNFTNHCFKTMGSIAILSAAFSPVYSADHWLSGVRTTGVAANNAGILAGRTSAQSVFDLTISLDTNPTGDDDSTQDSGADDDAQNTFEDRIKQFSNAVYQATNGAHKIGKVTIYRDKALYNSVDVQWKEDCAANAGPRANASSFGLSTGRIYMCTNWPGAATLMPTDKGSGYTLAHEWGHYTYGLFDEYADGTCTDPAGCLPSKPLATDTAAIPSIMNNQWRAARASGDPDYLEFSTANIAPFDGTGGTNAQFRVYGESGWATLSRDTKNDPKKLGVYTFPERTYYSGLTAPAGPDFTVNDAETTALSELNIQWISSQKVELTIDRSGSMSGSPIANAKTAANLLISQLKAGESSVGVVSFASSVVQNYPLTEIPDPDSGIKADAQASVSNISASGSTALYDGLMFALSELSASGTTGAVVYALSDGGDNASSETEASVISAYQAAGVPIVAFGYGSGAPGGTLSSMASATGGAYYQSPTTLAEIQAAFIDANASFSSNQLLISEKITVAAGGTQAVAVPVDSTLGVVSLNTTFDGAPETFALNLLNPANVDSGVTFDCVESGGSSSCTATLDDDVFTANGRGEYSVEVTSASASDQQVSILVSALPSTAGNPYSLAIGQPDSSGVVQYPDPMVILATTQSDAPITGLSVTAKVTDPEGLVSDITLYDDGNNGDIFANDGTYGAIIAYTADGDYDITVIVSNESGTAETSYESVLASVREDGTAFVPEPVSITENFIRTSSTSIEVQNFQADDHADDVTGGACTVVSDDNTDYSGRIDIAGDVDCFSFTPGAQISDLVFRVTGLSGGIEPILTLYDATGVTEIVSVDLSSSENAESGVLTSIAAASIDAAGYRLLVKDSDPTASLGGYTLSLGPTIVSDTPVTVVVVDNDNDSGGGSLSLLELLFGLAFFLFAGRRLRSKEE